MADIGLYHLDLADIAKGGHIISNFRLAHGNAHAIAALGEACYNRAPDKARAAENGDQFWPVVDFVRFGLHPKLLHESLIIPPDDMIAACFYRGDLSPFGNNAKGTCCHDVETDRFSSIKRAIPL